MIKTNKLAVLSALVFFMFGVNAVAQDCSSLLKETREWTRIGSITSGVGNLQGAAFLPASLNGIDNKDRIYVFRQRPANTTTGVTYANSYSYYDVASASWTVADPFTWAPKTHMGSASFGPSVVSSYTGSDGNTYQCHIPFVYVTGHAYLDASGTIVEDNASGSTRYITCVVLDLENQRIVKVFAFPNRSDDCIMAYDFAGNRVWVIGYLQNYTSGKAPYVIDEYRRIDMTDFLSGNPTKWNYTDIERQAVTLNPGGGTSSSYTIPESGPYCLQVTGGGPDADNIQRSLECGTMQDVFYYDNHLYIVTGRGSDYNRTEEVKVHCYYVAENQHNYDITIVAPSHGESQGIVFDGANIWITIGGGPTGDQNYLLKYARSASAVSNNMNFPAASEVSPTTTPATYSITNGYELSWFLQQVYGGRTDINAVLANDIDMTGITLPTSYYVYEKNNASGNRTFDAQYAFRGVFDGQNHRIDNLSITSTPYNNDGLFPWIIGATVKDFTITGNIILTTARNNNSGYGVENVGLIGTAEGNCTVTGINLTEFSISNPSDLEINNVNYLIGDNQSTGTVSNNQLPSDHSGGHIYNADGVCVATGDCDAKYQTPTYTDGKYQIANVGNLFWFQINVNAGTAKSNDAILVKDIDMKGTKYGTFVGFTNYTGTFDGNGKTISNFIMDKTDSNARTGMFNILSGSAEVKNFTLVGRRVIGGSQNMHGAVAGSVQGSAKIEDVISKVDFTSTSDLAIIGGVVGAIESTNATVNRCTYSGTITIGSTVKEIGGIAGNIRGGTISNCLFDGTIISETSSAYLNFGGIAGSTSTTDGSKIENCLSNGTFTVSNLNSDKCGVVFGSASKKLTITKTYYVESGSIPAVGTGTATVTGSGTLVGTTPWDEICEELDGTGNWEIKSGKDYPVPSKHTLAPHEHEYINGYCSKKGCDQVRQSVEKNASGYYEIANAGQFYSFVDKVNGGEYSAKAKLVASIDIDPSKITVVSESFIGFGTKANPYSGIFDGQGNTISGFTHSNTNASGTGFFNYTNGATIKDFTLNGSMIFNSTGNIYGIGSIVGLPTNTVIEDVTSNVNMTFTNCPGGTSGVRLVGGIAGRAVGSSMNDGNTILINRCRYSGTIDASASAAMSDRITGILGDANNVAISNCLFDGKIVVGATANLKIAGILGERTNNTVKIMNCLSIGYLSLASVSGGNCGMICGNTNSATVSEAYYSLANFTVGGVNVSTGYNKAGTQKENLKYAFVQLGSDNWHLENDKPIPGASTDLIGLKDIVDQMPSLSGYSKLIYARESAYMKGIISVCLPFDFKKNMLPSEDSKILKYKSTENGSVTLQEVKAVPAGVPFFVKLAEGDEEKDWVVEATVSESNPAVTEVKNPEYGIKGAFDKTLLNTGKYKLNDTGTALTKTTSTSNCYPYRAYIALPEAATKASTMSIVTE